MPRLIGEQRCRAVAGAPWLAPRTHIHFPAHGDRPVAHPSDTAPAPQPTASGKPAPIWEDFLDIFISPTQVFERRRQSGFVLPLIVLTVLVVAIGYGIRPVLQPMMDAEWARQVPAMMRQNSNLTPERLESIRRTNQALFPVYLLLGVPIAVFIIGLVLWGVGKFVDARESAGAAIMVATYAYFPRVLEQVVYGIEGLLMSPESLTSRFAVGLSLARFMNPDGSPLLLALASRVDVFLIWVTVLLGIGLAVVGRIPRGRAMAAAVVVWLLGALPAVLGALRTAR